MNIDFHTKMITLLGKPLSQSYAAQMQNFGYESAGLNMAYFYTETDETHLGDIVNGLRYMNFAGFAVTKPNKEKVIPYLDELDSLCEKIGACNTVVKKEDGRLIGYNTDAIGFYQAFTEHFPLNLSDTVFFSIGAGGVARAICSVLAAHGAGKIYITDLYPESAEKLVKDVNQNFQPIAEAVPFGDFQKLGECNVILNNSGIGMGHSVGESPVPKEYLKRNHICFDACYNPAKTQFLMDAESVGCSILNGLDMSLYQGTAQIELWTGKKAPEEAMRQKLNEILSQS